MNLKLVLCNIIFELRVEISDNYCIILLVCRSFTVVHARRTVQGIPNPFLIQYLAVPCQIHVAIFYWNVRCFCVGSSIELTVKIHLAPFPS